MKTDILTVCDSATDINGKLVIVGTFDIIHVKNFPAIYPTFAVAGRMLFDTNGEREVHLSIKSKSGEDLVPPQTMKVFVNLSASGRPAHVNFTLSLNNTNFTQPDEFTVSLSAEGKTVETKFFVDLKA